MEKVKEKNGKYDSLLSISYEDKTQSYDKQLPRLFIGAAEFFEKEITNYKEVLKNLLVSEDPEIIKHFDSIKDVFLF